MNDQVLQLNLVAAWVGIPLGIVSGLVLGLNFHREDWLGGYSSFKRRLYRLAHISLFGLALLNLMFFLTARELGPTGWAIRTASWSFLVGAASMPVCCVILAHRRGALPLFGIPVISLLLGATLTLLKVGRIL